jgi:hypothetical protein
MISGEQAELVGDLKTPGGTDMNAVAVAGSFVDAYTDTRARDPGTNALFYPVQFVKTGGKTFSAKWLCEPQTAQTLWSLIREVGIETFGSNTVSVVAYHPRISGGVDSAGHYTARLYDPNAVNGADLLWNIKRYQKESETQFDTVRRFVREMKPGGSLSGIQPKPTTTEVEQLTQIADGREGNPQALGLLAKAKGCFELTQILSSKFDYCHGNYAIACGAACYASLDAPSVEY